MVLIVFLVPAIDFLHEGAVERISGDNQKGDYH